MALLMRIKKYWNSMVLHAWNWRKNNWLQGEGVRTKTCSEWQFSILRGAINESLKCSWGLPWWLGGKESACHCRRLGFDSWSRKFPHPAVQLSQCAASTEPGSTGWAQSSNYWSLHALEPVLWTGEAEATRSLCTRTRE